MTLVHDSVWENPFAAFNFRFYPDGYEYSLCEALHPHWNEEKFGRLVREHHFDIPHQIEVVLGQDFFNLYPTVLLKISEGAFSISKLSGCPGVQCDKSKHVTLYMDYILDSDTQVGGIGLYEDAHGGQSIWKTVFPGFGPAYDTMGLMLIALNYAFERINTVYRSSKVTLVITPPGGIDIAWKFGKLTVERSEQIWNDLEKEWTGPLAILEYIKNFLEQRRHHATEVDVPELESVRFKIPETDENAKRAVVSVNRLARLGASGQLCYEESGTVDLVDESYFAFGISGDCLYRYRKALVVETMEELQYLAPWSMRVSSTQESNSKDDPTKGETPVRIPREQQGSKTHATKSPNDLNTTNPTTWLQMTASPLFGPLKDELSHLVCSVSEKKLHILTFTHRICNLSSKMFFAESVE